MSGEMIWGVVRTLLAAVAGYVVAQGWFDEATYNALIGAVGTIFVAIWSMASKKSA